MSSAQKNARPSLQEQLALVQGKVPEAKAAVAVEVILKEEATTLVVPPEVVPVVVCAPQRHEKQQRTAHTPKPAVVPQPEVKMVTHNVEREERPIVLISLGELRQIDLVRQVRSYKTAQRQVLFLLRKGPSTALFSLSYVGPRVRLCAREATGEFAEVFRRGTELFQDEIYDMRAVSPERLPQTTLFQRVLLFVEIRQCERRLQDREVMPAAIPADKRQPGFRNKFGGHREHRVARESSK